MNTSPLKYLPVPTPYEYALISHLTYQNDLPPTVVGHTSEEYERLAQRYAYLTEKGWYRAELVAQPNDYYGAIWVNEAHRQVVLSHRGSQNATSWVTDYESVVQLKPGQFTHSALLLLNHDIIKEYRNQGYRVSTTGHSLGGFLAQLCVYWSQRRDMQETYYPEMSAVVFDSPGAVDFIRELQPKLLSEQSKVAIEELNIHNFCGMPTLVSTYGQQTGRIWHLNTEGGTSLAAGLRFAFLQMHSMEAFLGGFNPETGYPYHYRQITDWPQADYSEYSSLSSLCQTAYTEVLRAPFDMMNGLYRKLRRKQAHESTWYEQLFREPQGAVRSFLTQTGSQDYYPKDSKEALETEITQAIQAHYAHFDERTSLKRLPIYHLDSQVLELLHDTALATQYGIAELGWNNALRGLYKEAANLLSQYRFEKSGKVTELVLADSFAGSVFEFERQLILVLSQAGVCSLAEIAAENIASYRQQQDRLNKRLALIEDDPEFAERTASQLEELNQKLAVLEKKHAELVNAETQQQAESSYPAILSLIGTRANAKGATVTENIQRVAYFGSNTRPEDFAFVQHNLDRLDPRSLRIVGIAEGVNAENANISRNQQTLFDFTGNSAPVNQSGNPQSQHKP